MKLDIAIENAILATRDREISYKLKIEKLRAKLEENNTAKDNLLLLKGILDSNNSSSIEC